MSKKLINIYGSPGSGKSTFALFLTGEMKMRGLNCEYASEYIKFLIAKGNCNFDQLDILYNQYHQILAYYNNSDIVITDSPLLLSTIYGRNYKQREKLFSLARAFNSEFNSINILIEPPNDKKMYKDSLRLQNYEQSVELFKKRFKNLLKYDFVIENFFSLPRENLISLCDLILEKIYK
jgi:nicotinamide riboside kinase